MINRPSRLRSQNRDKTLAGAPDAPPDHHAARDHHAALHQGFHWQVDTYFNIATVCCSRWARAAAIDLGAPEKVAIQAMKTWTSSTFHSFLALQTAADVASHQLRALGVQRGDRVAIVMPQRFETAAAYMAVFQMGAVAAVLSMLFGPEALAFRLHDSGAVVAIADESAGFQRCNPYAATARRCARWWRSALARCMAMWRRPMALGQRSRTRLSTRWPMRRRC